MKILRSWPERVPEGRAHVVDPLPRLVMKDYDYRILGDVDDDILLLEWDVAIDREGLEVFIDRVRENPDSVLVAPYRIYTPTTRQENLREAIWPMRRYNDGEQSMRYVTEGEPTCHLFGLGMTYMPKATIRGFLDSWPGHFSDMSFAGWHYKNVEREVPIAWESRAVHLHYLIERY